jgi:hypothetical protein
MKYIKSNSEYKLKRLLLSKDHKGLTTLLYQLYNEVNFDIKRYSPSVSFENEMNISGISEGYNIPFNLTESELDNLKDILNDSESLSHIFNNLLSINKKLNIFIKCDISKYYDIIAGVCSRFNTSDIESYIKYNIQIDKMPSKYNKSYIIKIDGKINVNYSKLYTKVYTKTGTPTGWFPSIETLKSIVNILK